ncbi:MAG: hypothetical protein CME65_10720 [Halobacteriovoraceae bacterium]|nr:hypothetical protein [Halobacteriovoraceae bacterium]|tara:strand:- start:3095 stop:4246 length:1152 start_codon:yes stop_codon:yes gene_type:complete
MNIKVIIIMNSLLKIIILICLQFAVSLGFAQNYKDLAKDLIKTKLESELEYDWTDALLTWAIVDNFERLEISKSDLNKIIKFYQHHDHKDLVVTSPDLLVSVIGALKLHDKGFSFKNIEKKSIDFILSEPKNKLGTFDHVGTEHRFFWWAPKTSFFVSSSIWTDSLIMYLIPSALFARKLKNEELQKFVRRQHKVFYSKLFDGVLYKHAYFLDDQILYPQGKYYWLRGNAWVLFSLVELYELETSKDQKAYYRSLFLELTQNLLNFLPEKGLFPTVLTEKKIDNYVDTAGNSILLYSFLKAARLEIYNDPKLIKRLWEGLNKFIQKKDNDTYLTSCSGPTTAFSYYWYYTKIVGKKRNLGYCLGPLIMALGELERQSYSLELN